METDTFNQLSAWVSPALIVGLFYFQWHNNKDVQDKIADLNDKIAGLNDRIAALGERMAKLEGMFEVALPRPKQSDSPPS